MDPRELFNRVAARAAAGSGTHARTGPASMLTSSKVVELIPTAPKGRSGLWIGKQAEGGFVSGPCYGSTREVLRDGVIERGEREVSEHLKCLFDYGNYMETVAFRWLGQLFGAENVAPGGRLVHPDPDRSHMSSTPDGVVLWQDTVFALEIKARTAPIKRTTDDYSMLPAVDGSPFWQDNIVLDWDSQDCWVGMSWPTLRVYYHSLVRAHHCVQTQMHMECGGLRHGLIAQVEPGSMISHPTLHLTVIEYQPALADVLLPYWDRAWAIIQQGREMLARGEPIPEDWPWKSGRRVSTYLPFDWECEAVRRLDRAALAWRDF